MAREGDLKETEKERGWRNPVPRVGRREEEGPGPEVNREVCGVGRACEAPRPPFLGNSLGC